jgi:hypothetical protein
MQITKSKALRNLANAVVLRAVDDYRKALRGKGYYNIPPEKIIRETEEFFMSDWFYFLTKLDGEYLIERLKKEVASEEDKQSE